MGILGHWVGTGHVWPHHWRSHYQECRGDLGSMTVSRQRWGVFLIGSRGGHGWQGLGTVWTAIWDGTLRDDGSLVVNVNLYGCCIVGKLSSEV
jgi:hypothetical protein